MNAVVLNWKEHRSGTMAGFFDLCISGLVIVGCRAFQKHDGKLWFAFPSQKITDRQGQETWKDVVTCAEPVHRHLQGLVRGQLRVLLDGGNGSGVRANSSGPAAEEPRQPRRQLKTSEGEDLTGYRSGPPTDDDVPF